MNKIIFISLVSILISIVATNEIQKYQFSSGRVFPRQKAPTWQGMTVENEKFVKKL